MPKLHFSNILVFAVLISLFGMVTIIVLAFSSNPTTYEYYDSWRKPIAGLAFGLVCVWGLLASIYPKTCIGTVSQHGLSSQSTTEPRSCRKTVSVRGHHFDCGRYSDHIWRVHGRCFCAACSGLALGASLALTGTFFYFFLGKGAPQPGTSLLLVGELGVVLGFVQFKSRSYVRLLLNAVFVLSAFLVLIEVDSLTESLLVDLYAVGVMLVWILARILLSQWDHRRICLNCSLN
jgi:hypothetical protein